MDQLQSVDMDIEMRSGTPEVEMPNFTPRGYQQEMFEESMKRNIIVAMATGSGKTDIAVMRVAAELERCDPNKLAWILTPTTTLCAQQHEKFKERLPGYQHRLLRGSDGVDKWESSYIWDAILKNIRIVVSTPQVLLDALTKGFVPLTRISLLVFDEAHRATGGAPMRGIMRHFYHCAPMRDRPATLSLTASPVGLENLEQILDAEIKTPTLTRAELERYVHLPELIKVSFGGGNLISWPGLIILGKCLQDYDFESDPWILEMLQQGIDRDDPRVTVFFEKKKKTYCFEQLFKLETKVSEILTQLGSAGADWYMRKCISRLKPGHDETQQLPTVAKREKEYFVAILERALEGYNPVTSFTDHSVSEKFKALIQQLSFANTGSKGIIFAKQRATVAVLAHMLSVHPDIGPKLRVGAIAGASSMAKKADFGDLFDLKPQEEALAAFQREQSGLLVATSVLEEGIDVPSCNFVVCYDEPENVVSYVQRRGRARKEKSKYVLFMPEDSGRTALFQRLEAAMVKSYREDRQTIEKEVLEELVEENAHRSCVIPKTGAKLTLENAKQYLFHFVQTISGNFTGGQPEYIIEKDDLSGRRTASLQLPGNIPPHLRSFSGTESWRTERAAVRDVSFVAMLALHNDGLLSDHLLPLLPEDSYEQIEILRSLASTVRVQPRIDYRQILADAWTDRHTMFPTTVYVESPEFEVTMTLMMPLPTTYPRPAQLFSLSKGPVKITWEHNSDVYWVEKHLEAVRTFTHLALNSVMPHRLQPSLHDYLVPFIPSEMLLDPNRGATLAHLSGSFPINPSFCPSQERKRMGIVRDGRRPRSKHILKAITNAIPTPLRIAYPSSDSEDTDTVQPCVQATTFSKRMYVLRPEKTLASTPVAPAVLDLPLKHCTMDNLPLEFSEFALVYPAFLHSWEIDLLSDHLLRTILNKVQIDPAVLRKALSAPSAHLDGNYQRLEFLGDRVLKFLVTLHLMANYPYWPEKYLSRKRDQIVSNQNLAFNALQIGLDRFITTAAFSGNKWRAPYVHDFANTPQTGQRMLSTKVIADVVEAIVGGCYYGRLRAQRFGEVCPNLEVEEDTIFLNEVAECINVLLPGTELKLASDALVELHAAAASEQSFLPQIPPELEYLIGYKFNNRGLLVTAITHPSFNREQCASYDRLEFLGDAVLDHIITTELFRHESNLPPSSLHTAKECLVSKDFLAFICLNWSTNSERVVLPDIVPAQTESSINFETTSMVYRLWNFMRHSCADITILLRTITARYARVAPAIHEALDTGMIYPWTALTELQAPKFLSDIIESLIGAVFIDSRGSLLACEALLERMGIIDYLERIPLEINDLSLLHPKESLGILAKGREVNYVLSGRVIDGSGQTDDKAVACTVYVADAPVARVVRQGFNRFEMEVLVAAEAVRAIETGTVELPDLVLYRHESEAEEEDGDPNGMDETASDMDEDTDESGESSDLPANTPSEDGSEGEEQAVGGMAEM